MAAIAFLLLLYQVNAIIIVLLAIVLSIVLFWNNKEDMKGVKSDEGSLIPGDFKNRIAVIIITGIIFIGTILVSFIWQTESATLLSSMYKIGALAFGNGMTIMPLLQQEAVITHHWLTMKKFADGIAFGQITPGPFLITATFISYKVSVIWVSLLATFGMFFPSFFYTLIMSEIYTKIRHYSIIRMALKGVLAVFTGMLLFVVISLGKVSLLSPAAFVYATFAFLLVKYFKLNILWIFIMVIAAAFGFHLFEITI